MTLVNALILSIPLLLFFGAAYVLACAWNEHRLTKQVSPRLALVVLRVFAWRPVIGFIAFLLAGLVFLRFVIFSHDFLNFLLFTAPLLMVSALFYASWRWQAPKPTTPLDAVA